MIESLILAVLWCDPDMFASNQKVIECRKQAIECVFNVGNEAKQIKCLLNIKISE
jgi:hypothetical protein